MGKIALVAIEKASLSFDKLYSYRIPFRMKENLEIGCRVIVPFGVANKRRQAIVLEILEELEEIKEPETAPIRFKEIIGLIDLHPIINKEMLMLLNWLKYQTFCTYYDALKVLIPAGIGVKLQILCMINSKILLPDNLSGDKLKIINYLRTKKKPANLDDMMLELELMKTTSAIQELTKDGLILLSETVRPNAADGKLIMAKLADEYEEGELALPQKMSAQQKAVTALLLENGAASVKEICYYTGVTQAVIKALEKKKIVELFGRQIFRSPYDKAKKICEKSLKEYTLTKGQQEAFEELWKAYQEECGLKKKSQTALLYGVTGSGKTQVFLRLIQKVRAEGKGVIVLVPEISLTPQTVDLFRAQLGEKVAVLHSGLTMVERADEYKRISQGLADVVVGTRSAVFAPLEKIGLIVIDEEQEQTYHSERAPKFHAREVAKIRCKYHGAMLLLASATPSVESFYYAQKGKYKLVKLPHRYEGRELPSVTVADMSGLYGTEISRELAQAISENIHNNQQSILLMNRRGYQTIIKCEECGEAVSCPNCSVTLTYHSANGRLMCHYCGYSQALDMPCKTCGNKISRASGAGTQKIEELLNTAFPNASILRMDMDTTMARFAHEQKFAAFANGEYQIMVGTQMVAKGLNFPNVTLVGVLNADQSLYAQDFRGCEKAFSLITQVVGRCGRGELPGRAIIQTSSPEHPVIMQAASQDYDGFFADEIKSRKMGLYPPFCDLSLVAFSGENQEHVKEAAGKFSLIFRQIAAKNYKELPLRVLTPCEPIVEKIAGKHRYSLLIKCRKSDGFCRLMWEVLAGFGAEKSNRSVLISIDMNYDGII